MKVGARIIVHSGSEAAPSLPRLLKGGGDLAPSAAP